MHRRRHYCSYRSGSRAACRGRHIGECAAATAYIADVSPEGDRPRLYGLVGATFGAGFVIGPALGGLAGSFDLRLPFVIAAGLSLANFCFGIFVLPESLEESWESCHRDHWYAVRGLRRSRLRKSCCIAVYPGPGALLNCFGASPLASKSY
jgi:MFS family permease